MQLLLMRHGIAADVDATMRGDAERPLTREGENELRDVAAELKETIGKIDLVVCSPLLRAKQTAAIINEEFKARTETWPELEFSEFEAMRTRLSSLMESGAGDATILCVGHMPGIGLLAQQLLQGESAPVNSFAPATVCALDVETFEPLEAHLLWHRAPQDW